MTAKICYWDNETQSQKERDCTPEEVAEIELRRNTPPDYREQRAAEYPPMTDYLDGIVKSDQAQVQAYIDACLAVKAKYPKT